MPVIQTPRGAQVFDHLLARAKRLDRKRTQRLAAITTQEAATAYITEVRHKIATLFAPLPDSIPTARITGTLDADPIRIEKIILEDDGLFPVTGLFFIPKKVRKPLPGVLCFCGHSNIGKNYPPHQIYPQMLARMGYAAFCFDPPGQGERRLFQNSKTKFIQESLARYGCGFEHNQIGKTLHLTGEGIVNLWMRDAAAAMNYLLSRPEVDASRIGTTGCSGGGNMSVFYPAVDRRVRFTAPSCWTNRYYNNIENEMLSDIEQILPGIMAAGLDVGDLLIARTPDPLLILAQQDDFFDARAVRQDYEEVRKIYQLFGKAENVKLFFDVERHAYTLAHREQMYRFFNRHAGVDHHGREDSDLVTFEEKVVNCTPNGSVLKLPGVVFLHQRSFPAASRCGNLQAEVRNFLKLKPVQREPGYRIMRGQEFGRSDLYYSRFAVQTAPGMEAILKRIGPSVLHHIEPGECIALYLPDQGTLYELPKLKVPEQCTEIYGLDVRGFGEMLPTCGDTNLPNPMDPFNANYFLSAQELVLGNNLPALQVQDILTVIKLLEGTGGARQIHLFAAGQGTIPAVFVALLANSIKHITLYHAPLSWKQMAHDSRNKWQYSSLPFGVLRHFDLPDLYRALQKKNLKLVEPWDNQMKPYTQKQLRKTVKQYGIPL